MVDANCMASSHTVYRGDGCPNISFLGRYISISFSIDVPIVASSNHVSGPTAPPLRRIKPRSAKFNCCRFYGGLQHLHSQVLFDFQLHCNIFFIRHLFVFPDARKGGRHNPSSNIRNRTQTYQLLFQSETLHGRNHP